MALGLPRSRLNPQLTSLVVATLLMVPTGCVERSRADVAAVLEPEPRAASVARPEAAPSESEEVDGEEAPALEPVAVDDPRPEMPGAAPSLEGGGALAPFFAALGRLERDEAPLVRVTHLGDSSIGMDDLPHALRRIFQARYGDGGPGFVLLERHSGSYLNRTVWLRNRTPWEELCFIVRRCRRDGRYGLGGSSVRSRGGAETSIRPREGREVRRAELWYAAEPGGGDLLVRFGDEPAARLSTRADAPEDRVHVIEAPTSGRHGLSVRALGGGPARAYGAVLEADGPGLVWDTLSMIGAFTPRLLLHDEGHFASQLARRRPDLVILNFGGNDLRRLIAGAVDGEGFEAETRRLVRRVSDATPSAGCLVVAVGDHERSGASAVRPEHMQAIVDAQRRAAAAEGCAFWDTYAAMGGAGSFDRWRRRGLASDDLKHLSPRGRGVIAARLSAAIEAARSAGE